MMTSSVVTTFDIEVDEGAVRWRARVDSGSAHRVGPWCRFDLSFISQLEDEQRRLLKQFVNEMIGREVL